MSEILYRVTLVGLGAMGTRHAAAYQRHDAFQLLGFCAREALPKSPGIVDTWS